jgi:hypothetical protein
MKKHFLMDCQTAMETTFQSEDGNSIPALTQMRIWFHLMLCPRCTNELRNLRHLEEIMRTDFIPPSPGFEGLVMGRLYEETGMEEKIGAPVGFSFRLWVIIGFFVLLSLSSSFFGVNFIEIADTEGLSFLLPIGITIGMVVSCYGALFIGSHLKELSTRFRIH